MHPKKITIQGKCFLKEGQPFIPKGINMVCKDKTKGYIGDYTSEDFKFLKKQGFNLIRLGIFWDGAEPEPGVYNEDYLSAIDCFIRMAAAEDIAVFLDLHQDLYGVVFEDGAPAWATLTDDAPHIRTDLWSESYLLSGAVQHAFDHFWADTPAPDGVGIRTHYIRLLQHLAEHFGPEPYVMGYDLMNEPFPGSNGLKVAEIMGHFMPDGDMSALEDFEKIGEMIGEIAPITASFEQEVLNPFYEEAARAIRQADPDSLILFESNYFSNAGVPTMVKPACYEDGTLIPGQVYAPHGYDILVDTEAYETGGCERVAFIFGQLLSAAENMNIPVLIGEWGCYPSASNAQKEQARFLLDLFKEHGIGNVYYDFSHFKDGGILPVLANHYRS